MIPAARATPEAGARELHEALIHQGRLGRDVLGYTGGPIPVGGMVRAGRPTR